jgi:hypothetical protein
MCTDASLEVTPFRVESSNTIEQAVSMTMNSESESKMASLFISSLCRSNKASIQAFAEGVLLCSALIQAKWASSPEALGYGKKYISHEAHKKSSNQMIRDVHKNVLHRAVFLHGQSRATYDGRRCGRTVAHERVSNALALLGVG